MDIEWAFDGVDGKLYIVQARPETAHSAKLQHRVLKTYKFKGKGEKIAKGQAVGTAIAQGVARVIKNLDELGTFETGEILIADSTTPDW